MITRREFIVALVVGAAAAPFAALAQQREKVWRVGFFYFGSRQSALETGRYEAFLRGMRELGHVEGRDFVIEARYVDGNAERLPGLAAELVNSKPDVILSTWGPMHQVLRGMAGAIPVVVTVSPDPVAEGLAKSLARPGGNFTGLANITAELSQKYVELLEAAIPKLSRIGVLTNPANPTHPQQLGVIRAAASTRGMQVFTADVGTLQEIVRGWSSLVQNRVNAVIVLGDGLFIQQGRQISDLGLRDHVPTLWGAAEGPEFGGLMSYGSSIRDNYYDAARFVDRILKGAKPGDIPIEQPTRFELVVNLKTAKALGLKFSQLFLMRADRVIE